MKADGDILIILAVQFSIIALLSFGGANAVLPKIHRQAVDVRGWITDRHFADMFAIAQAIPGPSILIVTLLGYHVAGFWGALVITLAMCGPTSVLASVLSRTEVPIQGYALADRSAGRPGADFCRVGGRYSDAAYACSGS